LIFLFPYGAADVAGSGSAFVANGILCFVIVGRPQSLEQGKILPHRRVERFLPSVQQGSCFPRPDLSNGSRRRSVLLQLQLLLLSLELFLLKLNLFNPALEFLLAFFSLFLLLFLSLNTLVDEVPP